MAVYVRHIFQRVYASSSKKLTIKDNTENIKTIEPTNAMSIATGMQSIAFPTNWMTLNGEVHIEGFSEELA
jgi:hypothetical protein